MPQPCDPNQHDEITLAMADALKQMLEQVGHTDLMALLSDPTIWLNIEINNDGRQLANATIFGSDDVIIDPTA